MVGQLWMMSGVTVAVAAVMGMTLGNFAVSQQPARQMAQESAVLAPDLIMGGSTSLTRSDEGVPVAIRCSGCGPTLADRRFAADRAAYDLYSVDGGRADPTVQDYLAQADVTRDDPLASPPEPRTVQQLPDNIVRFAAGDAPPPVVPTQAGMTAPAPPVMTAAREGRP